MNLKTRIATIATAAVLAVSAAGGAMADSTAPTVTQEIGKNDSGYLTASIASATLDPVNFSNTAQPNDGTLTLRVEDERGTNDGWKVNVSSTDFVSTTQGVNASIPADGFWFTSAGTVIADVGKTDNLHPAPNQAQKLNSPLKILYAQDKAGTGIYRMPFNVKVDIPAQQPVAVYRATLTVDVTSGPN